MTQEADDTRARAGLEQPIKIPFIFVPHGSEPPADWLAEHPGAIRMPATMVPQANADTGQTGWQIDLADTAADPAPPPGRAAPKPSGAPASIAPIGGPPRRRPAVPPDLRGREDPIGAAIRTQRSLQEVRVGTPQEASEIADATPATLTHRDEPRPDGAARLKEARVRAFLHLLRWLENTSVSDADSYRQRAGNPRNPITDAEMLHYSAQTRDITLRSFSRADNQWHTTSQKSTAAGAYQIIRETWLEYVHKLHITDFTPANQDAVARAILSHFGALPEIQEGEIKAAIKKLTSQWSSLPGGSQAHHAEPDIIAKYQEFLAEERGK